MQDPSKLLADVAADRANALLAVHDAAGAGLVLSRSLAEGRLVRKDQQRLLALSVRCRMLAARDRFRYCEALDLAILDPSLEDVFGSRLRLLVRIVSALESDEPWPDPGLTGLELIDELRENAERCAARGRFDDAVARLYRATHLLAQLRLRRLYGVGSKARAPSKAGTPNRGVGGCPSGSLPAGGDLSAAYRLLASLGDALGRYFLEQESALGVLLERRRVSLLGCGARPIDRESWSVLGPRWRAWLDGAQEIL